jgi:hypothetical protein
MVGVRTSRTQQMARRQVHRENRRTYGTGRGGVGEEVGLGRSEVG